MRGMGIKLKKQFRALRAENVDVKEGDVIEFPFSSEEPVSRWFGEEVLSHEARSIDMSRLSAGAMPLLWNHDPNQPIGMVETGNLGADRRLYARAKFFSTPFAQEKKLQMQEGLRNVSFGYQIDEMTCMNPGADGSESKYLATKWAPFEVSIVSVPADPTVGVGRDAGDDEREVTVINRSIPADVKTEKGNGMTEQEKAALEAKVRADAVEAERARILAIRALGEQFGKADLARQLIENGKSIDEARAAVLEAIGQKQVALSGNEAVVGLSNKEIRQYSFLRAIAALANPSDRGLQDAAGFEREVSEAAVKKTGKASRGIMIPVDVLRSSILEKRDLSVGVSADGGNLVSTNLLAQSFIELLRKKSVMSRAGATVLNGLVGNIAIPRQSGAATAYWVAEGSSPTESKQAFDQVSMAPKTLGAFTDFTRKLILQSSIDVEAMVRADLAAVIALELDRVALYGSGSSNQPLGLQSVSGVGTVDFAADAPTFAEIIAMETSITAANADVSGMKYLMNARGRGVLKGTARVSGYPSFIMENGMVNGYATEVSNQISLVSTGKEHYWFGNWADLMIGFWSGLDLMVDPYTGATAGTVRVIGLQDCDVAARHGESFCLGSNLT